MNTFASQDHLLEIQIALSARFVGIPWLSAQRRQGAPQLRSRVSAGWQVSSNSPRASDHGFCG